MRILHLSEATILSGANDQTGLECKTAYLQDVLTSCYCARHVDSPQGFE